MSATTVAAAQYWGYLIKADRTPSPIFEQLLLGIAHYINRHVAPWDTLCLTPTKLATFYRLVGGDYDPLFLDTSKASLSFIYQSLGCFHTLQPDKDPYNPPCVPALTPLGFVRWQTVQLLLEPEEHVPFLQEAVKRFRVTNPEDGKPFPDILPREVLPAKPDKHMTAWHDSVSKKLMLEAQASQMRSMSARPQMALSDIDPSESHRPSSADTFSIDQSTETSSIVDAAGYFSHPHTFFHTRIPLSTESIASSPSTVRAPLHAQVPGAYNSPRGPLRRSSSIPSQAQHPHQQSFLWPRDGNPLSEPRIHRSYSHSARGSRHDRTPSTLSTSSGSSDSSYTTSSASLSPVMSPARPYSTQTSVLDFNRQRDKTPNTIHHPLRRSTSGREPLRPFDMNEAWDLNGSRLAPKNDSARHTPLPVPGRSGTIKGPYGQSTRTARSADGRWSQDGHATMKDKDRIWAGPPGTRSYANNHWG